MAERLDNFLIHQIIARDEFPERLPAKFLIITFFRIPIATVATTIDGNHVLFVANDPACLPEIFAHLFYLAGIAPVGARLDGNEVADSITIKFEVYALGGRFPASIGFLANMDCQRFEKIPENGFFLR